MRRKDTRTVTKQISLRLPPQAYESLRRLGFELHRSHTRIVLEALVLYEEVLRRRGQLTPEEEDPGDGPRAEVLGPAPGGPGGP